MIEKSVSINSEKRIRQRFPYKTSVICYKNFTLDKKNITVAPFRVTVTDISFSGVGITCDIKLTEGTFLEFNINNKYEMRAMKFRVKWSKYIEYQYHCGLEFIDLTSDDIYFVNDIIKESKIKKKKKKHKI